MQKRNRTEVLVLTNPTTYREIQTLKRLKKSAVYDDKTQHANFRRNPPFQVTKRHLNGEEKKKKKKKRGENKM